MRSKFIVPALFAFIICSAAQISTAPAAGIVWHKNFKEARELAKQSGKPMLIDFAADWCKPCKEMERRFWPQPQIIALSEKFVCVALNFDAGGPEVSRYKVDRIPAVAVTDPWGNFITIEFGFGPETPDKLTKILQTTPPDFTPLVEWNTMLEQDKNNLTALIKVGDFYRKHAVLHLSSTYFKRALKTKEIEDAPDAREQLLIAVGINHLRQQEYGEAKKVFEDYLKEIPNGKYGDRALHGIFTTQLNRKKLNEAEKTLGLLRAGYPDSPFVEQAAGQLQEAKNQKK